MLARRLRPLRMPLFRLGSALQIQFGHSSHEGCCNFDQKIPPNTPGTPSGRKVSPTQTPQTPSSGHMQTTGQSGQTIGSIGHGCQGLKLWYLWHAMHCNFYFNLLTRQRRENIAPNPGLHLMASRCPQGGEAGMAKWLAGWLRALHVQQFPP